MSDINIAYARFSKLMYYYSTPGKEVQPKREIFRNDAKSMQGPFHLQQAVLYWGKRIVSGKERMWNGSKPFGRAVPGAAYRAI
jgi:hypothetical protein